VRQIGKAWTPGKIGSQSMCCVFSEPLFLVSERSFVFPTLVEPVDVRIE